MTPFRLRLVSLLTVTAAVGLPRPRSDRAVQPRRVATTFSTTGLSNDCSTNTTPCTTKSGTVYDGTSYTLKVPGSAGNFQGPPNSAVQANVFFATPGDYDKDGWADFVAADDVDKIYMMRNQTLTCGKTSCTGSSTVAPVRCDVLSASCVAANVLTSVDTWWNTLSNKRPAAFRQTTNTGGTAIALKAGVGASSHSPMASGDFDGDGWTDFIQVSSTNSVSSVTWPTAARLFLNTQELPHRHRTLHAVRHRLAVHGAGDERCVYGDGARATAPHTPRPTCRAPRRAPVRTTCRRSRPTTCSSAPRSSPATNTTSTPTVETRPTSPVTSARWATPRRTWSSSTGMATATSTSCTATAAARAQARCARTRRSTPGIDVWKNDCANGAWWNATTQVVRRPHPEVLAAVPDRLHGHVRCNNADIADPEHGAQHDHHRAELRASGSTSRARPIADPGVRLRGHRQGWRLRSRGRLLRAAAAPPRTRPTGFACIVAPRTARPCTRSTRRTRSS